MWHTKFLHCQIGHFEYKLLLHRIRTNFQAIWNSAVLGLWLNVLIIHENLNFQNRQIREWLLDSKTYTVQFI